MVRRSAGSIVACSTVLKVFYMAVRESLSQRCCQALHHWLGAGCETCGLGLNTVMDVRVQERNHLMGAAGDLRHLSSWLPQKLCFPSQKKY